MNEGSTMEASPEQSSVPVEIVKKEKQKLCTEGWLSLCCYLSTMSIVVLPSIFQHYMGIVPHLWGAMLWGPVLYYALATLTIRYVFKGNDYQIAVRASFLGFATACGILLILLIPGTLKQLGVYFLFMAFFHYSEFLAIAWCNPESLSVNSFVLNHSWAYALAAFASWLEFALEVYFLPDFKQFYYLWISGVGLCICGEVIRKTAMITASKSFTHLVQHERNESHKLVTHGIYAYVRHPAYVGWFWWSIGTQLILMNPVCIVAYTVISWKFFHDRIYCEEYNLINFFQGDYEIYQKQVPTGLPFIKGFRLD